MPNRPNPWLLAWLLGIFAIGSCGLPVRVGIEQARAAQTGTQNQTPAAQPRVFSSAPGSDVAAGVTPGADDARTSVPRPAAPGSAAPRSAPPGSASPGPAPLAPPPARAASVLTLPPVPQPTGADDVVGVRLESDGPTRRQMVTFGQVFARGQVPKGTSIVARAAGGELPTQLDVKTTHPDGSVRMGVVTVQTAAPADVMLRRVAARSGGALVNLGALQGRYDVRTTLTVRGTGEPRRHDFNLAALLERALLGGQVSFWLHGPLVTEGRIEVPVTGSMRLVADIRAFADGSVMTDLQFNNDIAMQPVGGTLLYDVRIVAGGKAVLDEQDIRHHQYQTWHRELWLGGSSAVNVVHDTAALARAGAVHNYDLTTGVDATVLAHQTASMAGPGFGILGHAGLTRYMPTTGGRADIGATTQANTIWLMTQHADAARYALAQADAAGSVPWHFFDRDTGTYLSAERYPKLWIDGRGGQWGTIGPTQAADLDGTGWAPDNAHQPDLSYVPYILTGSRYRYDQLEAQATYAILIQAPEYRQQGKAIVVNTVSQVRASAWAFRAIDHAAFIAPDQAPLGRFFRAAVRNCIDYLRSEARWRTIGEVYGVFGGDLRPIPGGGGGTAPWQQDFLASALALSAVRGVDGAREMVTWMANFVAGRFASEAKGFRPNNGTAFGLLLFEKTAREPYMTWREVEAVNIQRGIAKDGPALASTDTNTIRIARGTLASVVTATDLAQAREAWAWVNANLPGVSTGDFQRAPTWNIVPMVTPIRPGP